MPVPVTLPPPIGLIDIFRFKIVTPVPDSGRKSVGVAVALEGMESEALFAPKEVGEKRISSVQVPEGVMVLPEQPSFCMVNSPWFIPDNATIPITKSTLPVLERVIA